jgi:LacI family gluconate utilization system Gnt-I transcriptional repressor
MSNGRSRSSQANTLRKASVTLADVAEVAGVSKITASRALSNPTVVSPETRQRVHDAVARIGYIPNLVAGGLKSKKSRLIACIVPNIATGSAFLLAVRAMTEAFTAAGFQVMLGELGYSEAQEQTLIDAVIARRPDGVVVTGILRSEEGRQRLKRAGMPVVETWAMTDRPIDMLVGFSHRAVGAASARYLFEQGRLRPALIRAREPRGEQRAEGFISEARRLGMVIDDMLPEFVVDPPARLKQGREGLRALVANHPKIDALYCASDLVALGALIEAKARDIAVPERLAVFGFGDLDFAVDTDPSLSTVNVDSETIGREAAAMIMSRIEGRRIVRRVIDVGFKVVQRDSA